MPKKNHVQRSLDYLTWSASRRGVFIPLAHVDLCGSDWPAAVLLSQIVYWFAPSSTKATKATIVFDGAVWIAKSHKHFEDEVRLTRSQVTRALGVLKELGLVRTMVRKFAGSPTTHITVHWPNFFDALDALKEEKTEVPFAHP